MYKLNVKTLLQTKEFFPELQIKNDIKNFPLKSSQNFIQKLLTKKCFMLSSPLIISFSQSENLIQSS